MNTFTNHPGAKFREPSPIGRCENSKASLPGSKSGALNRLVTKRELAGMIGVSQRTIDGWVSKKVIPRLKISPRLTRFSLPAVFAAVREDGFIRSLAKGAVHNGIVCLNMVATDPAHLRRGFSRGCLGAILRWAVQEHRARGACLQVEANNASAIRLYESLGFVHELYRYDYHVRELCS